MSSGYDRIARMYDRNWRNWYLPAAMPALESLFFASAPSGSQVLDVCCGSGHVTEELVRRGYVVTGVDSSSALIAIAQAKLPSTAFAVQDVCTLAFEGAFDAALSTFDSLNHLLSTEDLAAAFKSIHRALRPDALFVFDMNLEEAYELDLRAWTVTVEDDSISLVRGIYDVDSKLGRTEIISMERDGGSAWRRADTVVDERCYSDSEITALLGAAGFHSIEQIPAIQAGMAWDVGFGRMFFRARA